MPKGDLLFGTLPDAVTVDGAQIPVRTDFRAWIRFEKELTAAIGAETDRETGEHTAAAVVCVVDVENVRFSGTFTKLLAALFGFYAGEFSTGRKKGKDGGREKVIYDYFEDAEAIFASFLEVYGVDLAQGEPMHWHKFLALFRSLPDSCKFSKIVSYRTCDLSKMHGEERRFYSRMKDLYALPDNRAQEEKDDDMYRAIAAIV